MSQKDSKAATATSEAAKSAVTEAPTNETQTIKSLQAQVDALTARIEQLVGSKETMTVVREKQIHNAEERRNIAVERLSAMSSLQKVGPFFYRVYIKKMKRPIEFWSEERSLEKAVADYERRFGTRFDAKRMEIKHVVQQDEQPQTA